ncbi:unnamed protein product [Amoebophrya sp. A25]|nr:unnamed protein product [Amoebophrya sp. A25]|eukprot:GSA25T00023996001.1
MDHQKKKRKRRSNKYLFNIDQRLPRHINQSINTASA